MIGLVGLHALIDQSPDVKIGANSFIADE